MTALDRRQIRADLAKTWLTGLTGDDRREGGRLLTAVVKDWAAEADPTPDPQTVLRFQREDLDALAKGRDPKSRLEALRLRVLGRRVDRLNVRALALGRAVKAGSVEDRQARADGKKLLREAESIAAVVRGLPPSPQLAPIRRGLEEAMLDALYAVEREAMSQRLDRD